MNLSLFNEQGAKVKKILVSISLTGMPDKSALVKVTQGIMKVTQGVMTNDKARVQ